VITEDSDSHWTVNADGRSRGFGHDVVTVCRPLTQSSDPRDAHETPVTWGHIPVGLVHGVRLLPSSWDRWAGVFKDVEHATVTAGSRADPETVEEAKAHPEGFANKSGAAGKWRQLGRPPTDSPTV
jgi:hypothetical protein